MITVQSQDVPARDASSTGSSAVEKLERRLVAVMFADVVGSCRLLAQDEVVAVANFREVRDRALSPLIVQHRGRVVHLLGDGALIEFADLVDAVDCAVAIQQEMSQRNRDTPVERQIAYRIGIHFGEVIADSDDLLGTAVNVAARLEQMASSGGILVSERVFEEIRDKTDHSFAFAGSHRLKNLPGIFKVFAYSDGTPRARPDGVVAAHHGVTLSPAAMIALIPFDTPGHSSDERLFLQGLNEELSYRLGRFNELSVIANESTRRYANTTSDIAAIGRELNADYIVTGSVVPGNHELRVFVRLHDARSQTLIWNERYKAELSRLFDLQEDIVGDLASKLPLRIERVRLAETMRRPTDSLDAYECFLIGKQYYHKKTDDADARAIAALERAIEIDPDFADPYAVLGAIRGIRWAYTTWGIDPTEQILAGRELIEKAVTLNAELARGHGHLGWNHLLTRDFAAATRHLNTGVELNPSDADTLLLRAYALCYTGEPEEAIRICHELFRLNPHAPLWYSDVLATAHFVAGSYAESLAAFRHASTLFPENYGWIAACNTHLGRGAEARENSRRFFAEIDRIWVGDPQASRADIVSWWIERASWFRLDDDAEALARGICIDV